jgi:hypothetical protein
MESAASSYFLGYVSRYACEKLIQSRTRREELNVESEDVHSHNEQARAELEKLGHRHTQEQERLRAIERLYQLFTADYRALMDAVKTVGRLALTASMRLELGNIETFARESRSRSIAGMDKIEMEEKSQTIKGLIRELAKRKREQDEEDVESEDDGSYQNAGLDSYGGSEDEEDQEEEVEGEEDEGEEQEL